MGQRLAPAVLAYVGVAVVSVGLGATAAYFYPASYGLTTAEALEILDDRPVGATVGWVIYSLALVPFASFRTWWLFHNGPAYRYTALRGSLWLWGAIGAPWLFYVAVAWDLQLQDLLGENVETHSSAVGAATTFWWLGALVCLLVAPVWSTVIGLRRTLREDRGLSLDGKDVARAGRVGA